MRNGKPWGFPFVRVRNVLELPESLGFLELARKDKKCHAPDKKCHNPANGYETKFFAPDAEETD